MIGMWNNPSDLWPKLSMGNLVAGVGIQYAVLPSVLINMGTDLLTEASSPFSQLVHPTLLR